MAILVSTLNPGSLKKLLQTEVQTAIIQRLGYILSWCKSPQKLTQVIENELKSRKTFWVPLLPGKQKKPGDRKNAQWKIIENTILETDL